MNTSKNQEETQSRESEFLNIDVKRILYHALRYWYLVLASVFLGVAVAYLINRYATRIYQVEASIIIKEAEEVSGAELLYNNPLAKFYRNYLNELYIIKSKPLIERTVAELNFDNTLYRLGDLKKSEIYKALPVGVNIIDSADGQPFAFRFEALDDDRIRLYYSVNDQEQSKDVRFGENIDVNKVRFRLVKTDHTSEDLRPREEYQYLFRRIDDVAEGYVARLNAEWAEEGSGVINLSITGSNPEKEEDFLNGLIRNYQKLDLENKNLAASNAIHFINEQLTDIRDSLNKAEHRLEVFKDKNTMNDLSAEASRLYEKMEGLDVQKTDMIVRDSYYDHLSKYLQTNADLDHVILPYSVGIEDPVLTGLISEMVKIQSEIKVVTHSDKLENPVIADKRRRIEELKNNILESMRSQKAVDKIKMDFLNKGIGEIEKQLNQLPGAERQLVNIQRNYALLENLYTYLLQKRAEAGITKASNTTDVVVVNPPSATDPISPKKTRNYALGLAVGVLLPFLFFMVSELSNTKVQSREDIEKLTSVPILGGVGHKRMNDNIEVLVRPKSAISESFRALRSNLLYFLDGREKGVFLITSTISGEGKTFTSVNLASVFALSGKKVLIVGADMRRPKIYPDFKLSNTTGLSSYLAGMMEFKDVVQGTEHENLDLISGGPVPPNPSELIMSKRMDRFLEEAKAKYDFIFIDSPPLALVADAFVLAAHADHTLFIVRQNYTPKNLLKGIDDFYVAGRIKTISIVLNDIYRSGLGYGYGYGYAYNYGYGYGYRYGKRNGAGYYEE